MKLAILSLAIGFCAPTMPQSTRDAYAKIIDTRSTKLGVDPLMIVEIIRHESGWKANAISKDKEDYGFGQIRVRYRAACLKPGFQCEQEKKKLLEPVYNLHAIFDTIEAWAAFCKQKNGSVKEDQWLQAYAGLNRPKEGKFCGVSATGPLPIPSVVKQFLKGRRALRLRLEALPPG